MIGAHVQCQATSKCILPTHSVLFVVWSYGNICLQNHSKYLVCYIVVLVRVLSTGVSGGTCLGYIDREG